MSNTIGSILRRNCSQDRPLYLYLPDDSIYMQSILDNVDADFIKIPDAPSPISSLSFNGIIGTQRSKHFDQLFSLSHRLHIPLICYEYLLPASPEVVQQQMRFSAPINIFSQNNMSKYWGMQKYHTISPVIKIQEFDEIVKDYKSVHFSTDQNGQQIINYIRDRNMQAVQFDQNIDITRITYYVNTLLQPNTIPDILKLLSVGAIICTLQHPLINEIIINNHNGILAEDTHSLLEAIKVLFSNLNLKQNIEKNAKETIKKQYSSTVFKKRWTTVDNDIRNFVFKGIL